MNSADILLRYWEVILQAEGIHCMRFHLNPSVISMNRKQGVNLRSSYFEEPRPPEKSDKSQVGFSYGDGLPFKLEEVQQTGLSLCQQQSWEAALPWLEAAFFHFPEWPETTFHLALAQARLGLVDEAKWTSKTLEDAGPNCVKTRLRLTWLNLEMLDWNACKQHVDRALETGFPPAMGWTIQVKACIRFKRYDEACELCLETREQPHNHQKQMRKAGRFLKAGRYDAADTILLEIFNRQLKAYRAPEAKPHPTSGGLPPLGDPGIPPPTANASVTMDPNQCRDLTRLRMESDFRKRFWIRMRLIFRDESTPMLLQEISQTRQSAESFPTIQLPTPLGPHFTNPSQVSGKGPLHITKVSGNRLFHPYGWLAVRRPWQDEEVRIENFTTPSMRHPKAQTSYWVLTASHPERIVGLGSLTPISDCEGHISATVAPLVAHHRQEINLFVTIMQSAKQTGLSRLTATVEPDSIEDTIIRRNGFRISHEEETLEASLNHWKQSGNQATFIAGSPFDAIARDFREEDWNQVLKLIQPSPQPPEPSSIHWDFPDETEMFPATFNPQLSTVIEHREGMMGVLLVRNISNTLLYISLHIENPTIPHIDQHTIIRQILERFVPLAIKQGYEKVKFKRRVETEQTIDPDLRNPYKNDSVISRTRILEREEINP